MSYQYKETSWSDALISWANRCNIPDLQYSHPEYNEENELIEDGYWFGLPRDKDILVRFEELNLSGLLTTDIPSEIRHLKQLKKLRLANGKRAWWGAEEANKDSDCITEIPSWISELTNLEVLDLSDNNISYVPQRITKLQKLEKLYLNGNRIECVTDHICNMTNLRVLWLAFNQLTDISENLRKLPNLDEVWTDHLPGADYGPVRMENDTIVICTSSGFSSKNIPPGAEVNLFDAIGMAFKAQ